MKLNLPNFSYCNRLGNCSILNFKMEEHFFQCPYCWEEISMLLDTSVRRQVYVEDCEVCCNPIELTVGYEDGILMTFEAASIEQ